jgi:integral membrane protein (TIGR01906 family)
MVVPLGADGDKPKAPLHWRLLRSVLRVYLTIAVPVFLTLLSVRLVMTPLFLQLEYNRPGFPDDTFGFSLEERMQYGREALHYLLSDEDIDYLRNKTFPDGSRLYNERELHHMIDVKEVTEIAFSRLGFAGIATMLMIVLLGAEVRLRQPIIHGLFDGSVMTLGIIGVIVLMAVTAWDLFFTAFHDLFFESGTWRFAYSDTLIRLFPEQFWFDAALVIGILTTAGAIIVILIIRRWRLV